MSFIAGFVVLAFAASLGQGYMTHGISPSVTSVTPSKSVGGIPPSVTSVTPAGNWWTGAIPQSNTNFRHRHHHNNNLPLVGYYYPYYPYYYDESADSGYSQPQPQQAVAEEPQAPAQTCCPSPAR